MSRRWLPHAIAVAITVPFAVWVALSDIRGVLPPAAWLLPLAGAYYLGLRIGREIVRGVRKSEDGGQAGRWLDGEPADADDTNTRISDGEPT